MNYKPVVAWGIITGGTAAQRANFFGSWGLLGDAPVPTVTTSKGLSKYYRRVIRMVFRRR